ncbi:hypothetical protein [Effusibacillus consociatus]|uniref:Uncharacterized protein n=1 Tax=Effusibacillus consociatus TaxID=1117041 RepID=A0ABV9PYP4_9BACL
MAKPVEQVMTQGVKRLQLSPVLLATLFGTAQKHLHLSTFIAFHPKGSQVQATDGNGKTLETLNVALPTKIWIIFDDYGNRWVATALLPDEY